MPESMQIEICVDSVAGVLAAEKGGAHRVELCDNLLEGGTTPSAGAIKVAREMASIAIHVMIRPRGGDFCYSPEELAVMRGDIRVARDLGCPGVVFGCLTPEGEVDKEATAALVETARPMKVTFHRAFDMCRDPHRALEDLITLGVDRLLTSGQEASVMEGIDLITHLIKQAGNRITIMPGCGLSPRNLPKFLAATGAQEVHLYLASPQESPMQFRNPRVFMGGTLRPPEYQREITDANLVREALHRINDLPHPE